MDRKDIRYALYRCKANSATEAHLEVLAKYQDQLDEFGMDISDFTKEWDINKTNFDEIVTGKIVKKYNENKSLFNSNGQLRD